MVLPCSIPILVLWAGTTVLLSPAVAQPSAKPASAGIYRTAGDFRLRTPAVRGQSARASLGGGRVVVTQKAAAVECKQRVPADSLWGYVDRQGRERRYFRGRYYQVLQADSLVLYGYAYTDGVGTVQRRYYFSAGAQEPVQPLTIARLRKVYRSLNPRFVALLAERKWYQSLTSYQSDTDSYRVVALHRQSLSR